MSLSGHPPSSKTLTDRQRQLVAASFARLVPVSAAATDVFYNHLWEIAPETKQLFQSTDMPAQGMKLMQTLGMAVRALHDPETLYPLMHDLGKRHVNYGVKIEQFAFVKLALLKMIEHVIGGDFTDETREAWIAAYDMITDMTISAYES